MERAISCNITSSPRGDAHELPDRLRCVAWRKNCACGHHFRRTDLYSGRAKSTRKKGTPPACPQCGRERERCCKPRMLGTTVCRSHGGRGVIKKAFIPGLLTLTDEEILTLEEMMAEDDMTLKREFHLLRLFFGKAMAQFQQVSLDMESNSVGDVIGEMRRLAAIVDRLSSITERRVRVMESVPKGEPEVRVRFDDPRVQYLLKEKLREMHHYTIRLVLAVVIQYADPTGALGLAGKLPKSFAPFLPSSSEAKQLEASNPEEGLGALENTDMVL